MLGPMLRAAAGNRGVAVPMDYIARWDMAGDSTDETGNYNITLSGGAVQNSDHVDYDGVNDYGQCARLALNGNEFTIIKRFKIDAIDSDGVWIINSRSATAGAEREFQIIIYPPSSSNILCTITNTAGTSYTVESTTAISSATWYTFAFRFTGSVIEIFNETSIEDSIAFSGTMNTGAANTQFAKRGWDATEPSGFGDLDQSRGVVYDYALSDADLAAAVNKIKNGW